MSRSDRPRNDSAPVFPRTARCHHARQSRKPLTRRNTSMAPCGQARQNTACRFIHPGLRFTTGLQSLSDLPHSAFNRPNAFSQRDRFVSASSIQTSTSKVNTGWWRSRKLTPDDQVGHPVPIQRRKDTVNIHVAPAIATPPVRLLRRRAPVFSYSTISRAPRQPQKCVPDWRRLSFAK